MPETTRKGTGMRVLLIEDDSATAQSIELMLKSETVWGRGYVLREPSEDEAKIPVRDRVAALHHPLGGASHATP